MKYLVYFKPPDDLRFFANLFRNRIRERISKLPGVGLHCTLRVGRFDPKHEQEMLDALDQISVNPFQVSLEDRAQLFHNNTLVLPVQKSAALQQLHNDILGKLNDYLDWDNTFPLPAQYVGDSEREDIFAQHGSPFVAQLYNPHITLCKIGRAWCRERV